MLRRALCAALAALTLTAAPSPARAEALRLTRRDVTAITDAVRALFEGARDGDAQRLTAVIPTRAEFVALFQPGTLMFIERHQRAIERDVRALRTTFAGGTFVSIDDSITAGRALAVDRCGRFGARGTQCATGPVVEYRVGAATRRFRVDRIVRLRDGSWKIFDARL